MHRFFVCLCLVSGLYLPVCSQGAARGADASSDLNALIADACAQGRRELTVVGEHVITKPVNLPSDFTLVLDGARLTQGTGSFCNVFRVDGATNVTILGRNGAVVSGGVHNGLTERNAGRDGRPPIWVNNLLLFSNVRGFRVEGVRFERQRWWALNFVGCSDGIIRGISFLADHTSVNAKGEKLDYIDEKDYAGICVKNADGIDIRGGCHDIVIDDVTGFCEDDVVALTDRIPRGQSPK